MIEPANGIEHDAVEAVDTGEIHEVGGMTLRIHPGDTDGRRRPDHEDVVAREVAVCTYDMKPGRDIEIRLWAGRHLIAALTIGKRRDGAVGGHQEETATGGRHQPPIATGPGEIEDPGQMLPWLPADGRRNHGEHVCPERDHRPNLAAADGRPEVGRVGTA